MNNRRNPDDPRPALLSLATADVDEHLLHFFDDPLLKYVINVKWKCCEREFRRDFFAMLALVVLLTVAFVVHRNHRYTALDFFLQSIV